MAGEVHFFLCYNRDELMGFSLDGMPLPSYIVQKRNQDPDFRRKTYFDDLDFKKTDPQIFASVKEFLSSPDCVLLYISDSTIVFRWAEKEIVQALEFHRPIVMVRPKAMKKGLRRKWPIEKIARKGKRLF